MIIITIIYFIIILIISIIITILITSSNKNNKKQTEQYKNELNYNNYYKPKKYITTKNELKFYITLLEIAKELDLIVFSQVSLYNIVETKKELDNKTKTIYFNKIASKSIDFVIVRKKDCRILLCIELDDSTHKEPKRQQRDKFINKLFKELEINLLRYPIYNEYYKETLKKRIKENMKEHYYID